MSNLIRSLSTRVALVISAVLFVLLLASGIVADRQLSHLIEDEKVEHATRQASSLMATLVTLMLNGNGTLAREWLDNLHGANGILDIEVVDGSGTIAFRETDTLKAVNAFLGYERFSRERYPHHTEIVGVTQPQLDRALRGEVVLLQDDPAFLSIVLPIPANEECLKCHGYDKSSVRGVLALSVSTEEAVSRIAAMRTFVWPLSLGLLLVLYASLWVVLRGSVLRPVAELRHAIARVRAGERGVRLPVERRDELGEVAIQFNRMQAALADSEARIRAVMDNVVDGIVTSDERGIIESVNPAVTQLFGYSADELIGASINRLMPDEHRDKHDQYIADYLATGEPKVLGVSREVSGRHKSGKIIPIEIAVSEMRVAGKLTFITIMRDITVRKEQTAALKYQALHDPLTDLPNRTLLYDRLKHTISVSHREGRSFALIAMDLDRFKDINDTLGHHIGDMILQKVAACVRGVLRESDTVARLGGDEFSVILPGMDAEHAAMTAKKILKELQMPFAVDGHLLEVGASLGIALFPAHGQDSVSLMQHADIAMYAAKRSGEGHALYDPEQDVQNAQQLALLGELRGALENGQLQLHYQPRLNLQNGQAEGVEALLRWYHPQRGVVYPDEFIPLAEKSGLGQSLTCWVLETALEHLTRFDRETGSALNLSLNLSMSNLQDPGFPKRLRGMLELVDFHPQRLILEVTEEAIMQDPLRALEALHALRGSGISLSVDRFGTGYSSLVQLHQIAVNEIKVDLSFINTLQSDPDSEIIVRSAIGLAHNLGLRAVAVGIEERTVYERVKAMGCDVAQGRYIAEPMAVADAIDWINASDRARQGERRA